MRTKAQQANTDRMSRRDPVVHRKPPTRTAWSIQTAVIPEGVKVQHCPGYVGDRHSAEPGFVGGFMSEWEKLRK